MPSEKESVGSPENSRKSSKPIMEKRRRARINASLTELKSLLLEVMKKEGTRHNKMEKADILEMTVKHLRQIQRQQFVSAANTDPTVVSKYQVGFAECATEVTRYLSTVDGVDVDLKTRMLNHLANSIQCMTGSTQVQGGQGQTQMSSASNLPMKQPSSPITIAPKAQTQTISANVSEINNNCIPSVVMTSQQPSVMQQTASPQATSPQKIFGGIQLFPSRMPNGDVAFIIPGNALTNNQVPGYVIPLYAGSSAPVLTSQAPQAQVIPIQTVLNANPPQQINVVNEPQPTPAATIPEAHHSPSPPVDLSTSSQNCNVPMNLSAQEVTSNHTQHNQPSPHRSPSPPEPQRELKIEVENRSQPMDIRYEDRNINAPQKVVLDENVWRPW